MGAGIGKFHTVAGRGRYCIRGRATSGGNPTRLYHFLKACHAIDNVGKNRVKISLWMDVNDPWELKPFDLSDARNLRALVGGKTEMSNQFSADSLCKHWGSALMGARSA